MYAKSFVSVSGGNIIISTKKEATTGIDKRDSSSVTLPYASGEIDSYDKYLYGKFEARVWCPSGGKMNPAFWLWEGSGTNNSYCEIDIFEGWGESNPYADCTVHDSTGSDSPHALRPHKYVNFTYETWHKFTMEWTPYKISFWLDDIPVKSISRYYDGLTPLNCDDIAYSQIVDQQDWPAATPSSIIFNTAVRSNLNGVEINNGETVQYKIDYIKVWQRLPEISGVDELSFGNTANQTYSLPFMNGATYSWSIPGCWSGSSSSNSITVTPNGTSGGAIMATVTFLDGSTATRTIDVALTDIPSISGPDNLCTSASSYDIDNVPSGTSVTWSCSSNINDNIYGGTGWIALAATGTGKGWVEASITNSGCDQLYFTRKDLWLGKPLFFVDGDDRVFTNDYGAVVIDHATYDFIDMEIISNDWTYSGPISYMNENIFSATFRTSSTPGFGTIYSDVTNSCGTTQGQMSFEVIEFISYAMTPNPATTSITIEQLSATEAETRATLEPTQIYSKENVKDKSYKVEIWHEKKGKLKNKKFVDKKSTIDISDLENGSYILRLESEQALFVEHFIKE